MNDDTTLTQDDTAVLTAPLQQRTDGTEMRFVEETFDGLDLDFVQFIKDKYIEPATTGSAGVDLRYIGPAPVQVGPGETFKVNTGLSVHLKNPQLVGLIAPRSGLGSKGLVLANLIGIIDSDYTGELIVNLWNRTSDTTFTLEPGERIAQYMVIPRFTFNPTLVDSFGETERGAGGFGSSGRV